MTFRDGGPGPVKSATMIANGYTVLANSAALVLGPTGLAYDPTTDTLYVASTNDNTMFAVPHAGSRTGSSGTGAPIFRDEHLRGPLALVFAPNGDLLTSNGDAVNGDPTQPSEIVEFTKTGKFVGQFNVDAGQGGAFGLTTTLVGLNTARLAFVDDNANNITALPAERGSASSSGYDPPSAAQAINLPKRGSDRSRGWLTN